MTCSGAKDYMGSFMWEKSRSRSRKGTITWRGEWGEESRKAERRVGWASGAVGVVRVMALHPGGSKAAGGRECAGFSGAREWVCESG